MYLLAPTRPAPPGLEPLGCYCIGKFAPWPRAARFVTKSVKISVQVSAVMFAIVRNFLTSIKSDITIWNVCQTYYFVTSTRTNIINILHTRTPLQHTVFCRYAPGHGPGGQYNTSAPLPPPLALPASDGRDSQPARRKTKLSV